MRRAVKYIIITLMTIEITLICLFLPSELSKWQDRQGFGSILFEDTEDIKVERNQQLTMLEKLDLFINLQKTSDQINIKQGKYLKEEDLPKVCERELKQLEELGILESVSIDMNTNIPRVQPTYFISMEDPTKSMIVWNIDHLDGKSYVNLSLDDETGKILSYMEKTEEQEVNTDADTFVKELGQYYGVNVDDYSVKRKPPTSKTETDYQASIAAVMFSEGDNKLECGIQLYPNGWYYFGY